MKKDETSYTSKQKYNAELYEKFHTITLKHKNIIKINDFTHGYLLKILNRYINNVKTVLDIGCGTGAIDFYLAKKNIYVEGIDISKKAIRSCNLSANQFGLKKNTHFTSTSIEKFNTKKQYDIILCIEVLEHVENEDFMLTKMYDFLSNNGVLIISCPSNNAPLYKAGLLKKFDYKVGHLRRYSPRSLEKLLKDHKFQIKETILFEGIVRNYLFTSWLGGKILLRIINKFSILGSIVSFIDKVSQSFFGESDIIIIATK